MSPWKVILATLVIFCSGLGTGTLLVSKNVRPVVVTQPTGSPNLPPLSAAHLQQKEFLRKMDRELHLSPQQYDRVEKILKESQERTKTIREKIAPEMKEEVKRVREQIRGELQPDQQKKFEEALKPKGPRKEEKGEEKKHRKERGTNVSASSESSVSNAPPAKP